MNLKLLSIRLKDSSEDLSQQISNMEDLLSEKGVDYEPQDIGEPSSAYLAYLNELLPVVNDSVYRLKQKASSLSALIPKLDFYVDLYDVTLWKDFDGSFNEAGSFHVIEEKELFVDPQIKAGSNSISLFGVYPTLRVDCYVTPDTSGDYYTPDGDEEIEITDSYLDLYEIAGVLVLDNSGVPVVFIQGSLTLEDFTSGSSVFGGVSFPDLSETPIESLPSFGEVDKSVLKVLDEILEKYIGYVEYSSESDL